MRHRRFRRIEIFCSRFRVRNSELHLQTSPLGSEGGVMGEKREKNAKAMERRVIGVHLILTLYGHWGVNDPRGSGSMDFYDQKFEPLGSIHHGRKRIQPARAELKEYHREHADLLNFPIFWLDDAKAQAVGGAIEEVIRERKYTCYACAICSNHVHLVIRTHRDDALTMLANFGEAIRTRLRLCFSNEISPHHPVVSARPYKVFLYTPDEVRGRIDYVEANPMKEGKPRQSWSFVTVYDNFPFHKRK